MTINIDDKGLSNRQQIELSTACRMLARQYKISAQCSYVNYPVAHALYETWKAVDLEKQEGRK